MRGLGDLDQSPTTKSSGIKKSFKVFLVLVEDTSYLLKTES